MDRRKAVTDRIRVEVVFATPRRQELVAVDLPGGATVEEAIRESAIQARFDYRIDRCPAGIWGRVVDRSCRLEDGDRVEIYRPLERDPREARRELAKIQRFGSSS